MLRKIKNAIERVIRGPGLDNNDNKEYDKEWGEIVTRESIGDNTIYHAEIDPNKLSTLSSYCAISSGQPNNLTTTNVNSQFFEAYGPDFENKSKEHISVDLPWRYLSLLQKIKALPNVTFKTCDETLRNPPSEDQIVCTIRHDVDGDLVSALQQAKIEHELGITTSYYLLHNAPYYGQLKETGNDSNQNTTTFARHEDSLEYYLAIQEMGHELALHTDAMDYYQRFNTNGSEAIVTELNWLRKNGCRIEGTTAHNSFSVYGCNNYSIFKNRPLNMSAPPGPMAVTHKGRWAPLQMLDEFELGLHYESNELFWQEETPLFYGSLMSQNNWFIAENQYALLADNRAEKFPPTSSYFGTHEDLIDAIRQVDGPAIVKLVVHPMHYGLRGMGSEQPWLPQQAQDLICGNVRYWAGGGENQDIEGCAITYLNEFATPDRGLKNYESGDLHIAIFGGLNVISHKVNIDSKYPQVLARLMKSANCAAISSGDIDFDIQLFTKNLTHICEVSKPKVIVIHPDSLENINSSFLRWVSELSSDYNHVVILVEKFNVDENSQLNNFLKEHDNLTLLDPAEQFQNYQGSAKLTWNNSKNWTDQGHSIVGKALANLVIDLVEKTNINH